MNTVTDNNFDFQVLDMLKIAHIIINKIGNVADIKYVKYDESGNREEYKAKGSKMHGKCEI